MPDLLTHELLLLSGLPVIVVAALLIGHLVALRGLERADRVAVFKAFAAAMTRRGR
ncbi:hypothetical protein ACFY2W_30890 [Streptomyces sp. NPDC001262]|uniref:hypothetical protein n=1 Tax=Streptomyces sp. NPDC001262 TaxID=3364552 RepID=UPI0036BE0F88